MSRGHTHCEGCGSAESPPTRFAQPRQGLLSASSRDGPSASVPSQGHLTSQPGHLGNRPPKRDSPSARQAETPQQCCRGGNVQRWGLWDRGCVCPAPGEKRGPALGGIGAVR